MKSYFIPEPDLIFSNEERSCDPRIGLLNFGPFGCNTTLKIPVGIIGTKRCVQKTKQFLNRLKYHIPGVQVNNSNTRSIDFPGVYDKSPLKFEFEVNDEYSHTFEDSFKSKILSQNNRKDSIELLAKGIDDLFSVYSDIYPKPIILLPIDSEILNKCKDFNSKTPRIRIGSRRYDYLKRISLIDEQNRPLLIDFHHYMKVLGFKHNITTQIILPSTLSFSAGQKYDPATIAWNFSSALYYKSTQNPWKVADINPDTIHIGISFYLDIGKEKVVKRAAMAQVYMRNAESQIIRGLELDVNSFEDSRKTNLTKKQAKDLIEKSIDIFKKTHKNVKPTRVIIHKSSPYENEEKEGIFEATERIEIKDLIHIKERCNFRPLAEKEQPIARGSVFETENQGKKKLFIYTTGYIPCYNTYPGSQVPNPIEIRLNEIESEPQQISHDIMQLTKLDWNSTDFCTRTPCTISVARKVGKIMGELQDNNIEPPTAYCFYM